MHMGQLGHVGLGTHNSACSSPDSLLPLTQGRCLPCQTVLRDTSVFIVSVQCSAQTAWTAAGLITGTQSTHKPAPHKPSSCERVLPVPITSDEFWHHACVGASKAPPDDIHRP